MKFIALHMILLLICSTQSQPSLKSLHILFRHGERSPSKSYPNDPYKDHPWPGGFDQLNNRGKLEMYSLGKNFRTKYDSFIPKHYLADDVHISSSYADRCQMSAQLFLAGLYPPVDEQIWNLDLLWQPIPVHYVPRAMDNKIAIKRECHSYKKALDDEYKSDSMKEVDKTYNDLYIYLSNKTGDNIDGIRSLETLYNILEIEQLNGLELPSWTKSVFPDQMKNLSALSLAIFTRSDFMKKMHGGELVKEIITNIGQISNGTLSTTLFLYSGHDLTVVSLMRILGIEALIKPDFGAAVIIEHHNINDADVIKFFYMKNPMEEPEEKLPKYCNEKCDFAVFKQEMKTYISDDWEAECQRDT